MKLKEIAHRFKILRIGKRNVTSKEGVTDTRNSQD